MKAIGAFFLPVMLGLPAWTAASASASAAAESDAGAAAFSPPSPLDLRRDAFLDQLGQWKVFFPESTPMPGDDVTRRLLELRAQYWDIGSKAKEVKTSDELRTQESRFEELKKSVIALLYPQLDGMSPDKQKEFVDATLRSLNAIRAKKPLLSNPADVAEINRLGELTRTAMGPEEIERLYSGEIAGFGASATPAPALPTTQAARPARAPFAWPNPAPAPWAAAPSQPPMDAPIRSYLSQKWGSNRGSANVPPIPAPGAAEPPSPFAYRDVPNLDDLNPEQLTKIARRLGWTRSEVAARIRKARQFNVDWKLALATGRDPKILDSVLRRAQEKNVDPMLMLAVMKQESGGNVTAISPMGARGLMQIMPDTGRWLARQEGLRSYNLFNADDNIRLSARYLRHLCDMFHGATNLVLAAYNAGENAVLKYGGVPPYRETKAYVKNIFSYITDYKARIADLKQIIGNTL